MAKSFDLTNSSDMKKFAKNLESELLKTAKKKISLKNFDIECPYCKSQISVPSGKSTCPICEKEIDLTLNFNF